MNKLLIIVFLLGAIGSFVMSQSLAYHTQDPGRGAVGMGRVVNATAADRAGYLVMSAGCAVATLYFIAKERR